MSHINGCALIFGAICLCSANVQAGPTAPLSRDACKGSDLSTAEVRGPFMSQGHAYLVTLRGVEMTGDTNESPRSSRVLLCEGDRALGPAHSAHEQIRTVGKGRFSHWHDALYFSSSDNTDPNINGRTYRVVWANAGGSLVRASGAHAHDQRKHGEHTAALNLVPDGDVTHVAIRSGRWSDPQSWLNGARPSAGARVRITHGATISVDGEYAETTLDSVRVDGILRFEPETDTALTARTFVVTEQGHLQIGSEASPVRRDVRARLLFAPRVGRDRRADPFDLAGGLISQGTVTMVAERRTSHLPLAGVAAKTTRQLEFGRPPGGWLVGDRLLVPGTHARIDQDELRTIAAIHAGGRVVELDRPLQYDHHAPPGALLWVGNLTRNIVVQSVTSEPLAARGHLMVMHVQTGTLFDGVAFLDLGRTDTRVGHTFPAIGPDGFTRPGSDDNTIGRYAVHFHVRSGARTAIPPHVVRNCVVMNSPKYGIVNHGGNVLAEDNVTFRVAGSHLVAENGSEIGVFRRNMAVRSSGSGDPSILSRMGIYDNAHGGNGIWLVSGGVEVTGNWASGHADSGLKMLGMRFFEQGHEVFFDGRNTGPQMPPYADASGRVALADVNLVVRGNTFVASANGIELWNHKESVRHNESSLIEGNTVWNVQARAIFLPYTRNTTLRGNRLFGPEPAPRCESCVNLVFALRHRLLPSNASHDEYCTHAAIEGNHATSSISVVGGSVERFTVGIRLPQQGRNVIRGVVLDNAVDIEIPAPGVPERHIHLDEPVFKSADKPWHLSVFMHELAAPFSGDVAVVFGADRIDMTTGGRNQRLFFPAQADDALAFRTFGPKQLRAMTSGAIERRFGLAVGGTLAPERAQVMPGSNALSVAEPFYPPASKSAELFDDPDYWKQWLYDPHAGTPVESAPPGHGEAHRRWSEVRGRLEMLRRQGLIARETTPVKFMLHPSLEPLQIHPDDLPYGFRILVYLVDKVDGQVRVVSHFENFHNLKVDPDGMVRVRSQVARADARQDPVELTIRVTPTAVRRGSNIDYFLQRAYCGDCGAAMVMPRALSLLANASP